MVGTTLCYIWIFHNDNVFAKGKLEKGDIVDSIREFSVYGILIEIGKMLLNGLVGCKVL